MSRETPEAFMKRKHVQDWQKRQRSVLRGYIPSGLLLEGERWAGKRPVIAR